MSVLSTAELVFLAFLKAVVSEASRWLEEHVVNAGHETVLVLIKHTFIVLIVLIPLLWISWVLLSEDKHEISLLKPGILIRISDDILNLLEVLPIVIDVSIPLRSPQLLGILLIIQIFVSLEVDPGRPVEAKRDHRSPSGQVVEEL